MGAAPEEATTMRDAPVQGRITDEAIASAKALIGMRLRPEGPYLQDVTLGTIRNFCNGVGDLNPLYRDVEYGRNSRYANVIAPPMFPMAYGWLGRTRWGFAGVHGFYAGNDWELFRNLRPGDRISAEERVVGVDVKDSEFSGRRKEHEMRGMSVSDGRVRMHLIVIAASVAATLSSVGPASAADAAYPTRPIRLIVPYAPGGGADVIGRLLAQDLSSRLAHPIVVDNRAGGGGQIGIETAARATPDGHTLLLGSVGLASMPALYKKLPFDLIRDFVPISISISGAYLLGINPSVSASSVKELVALAKRSPGKLNFGSSGAGSTIYLAGEMFKTMGGIDIVHVPYKSAGLAMTDLIAGNIQMMFAPVVVMQPMAKAGKVRALGVTSSKRSALAPDIPTIAESALPGFEVSGWYGLLAPAATPRAIINYLYAESRKGLETGALKERLKVQGLEVINLSPTQSAVLLKEDAARWSRVIREAGIKAE